MAELEEKLRSWTLVDELVLEVHALTKHVSAGEHQEMPSLLRSTVVNAALRIVQGVHGRGTEFDAALRSALGSLSEFRYYLYLAKRLGIIDLRRYRAACLRHDRVQKFLREVLARSRETVTPVSPSAGFPSGCIDEPDADPLLFSKAQDA